MLILGCIRHITDFSIEVELPGLIFGHINITRISDPFTKILSKQLELNNEEVSKYLDISLLFYTVLFSE